MKTNTRQSSFVTVAKNIETMIAIDLSIGLDFEVTKFANGNVGYMPVIGTKSISFQDLLENPANVMSLLNEQPNASKKIAKMIKQHEKDYKYAVVVFKLLKQKITEPLDCVR